MPTYATEVFCAQLAHVLGLHHSMIRIAAGASGFLTQGAVYHYTAAVVK
jgi:hypothetical protein